MQLHLQHSGMQVLVVGCSVINCCSHLVLQMAPSSVPFVVLIGLHKLSPLFASDANATLNDLQSPGDIIPYDVVCQHLAAPEEAYGADTQWRHAVFMMLLQAKRLWR